ncbi:acyl-CoA dehydrogenase [Aldersonia sp. NBC_00410]|uniref:acyl-CoA dehydrogenase family protein n=1 Tax=Aldersonia sp. NBC_00410 TaxID=2975954 RepID=UPI0022556371|nr:acyl-CoA dehydrogenase family protein [Aldersonia sp. NBC_00410]MCX5045422.1 acyl-CoA dehydrogenase [Aldersonia sp. NBC_00410]
MLSPVARQLRDLEHAGELELPDPGAGRTWERWERLAGLARRDTVLGRLAEAHADAVAILHELDGPPPERAQLWGVWAAEPPSPVLDAIPDGDRVLLNGRKLWCSGASICDHALITARAGDERALYAVDLREPSVRVVPDTWHAVGMADSDSGAVEFDHTPAVVVGKPGEYLRRAGFWHGAIGVAACWYGAACAVADPLHRKIAEGRSDEHGAAHLGAVAAVLHAAGAVLRGAAAEVDADPFDHRHTARLRALRVRAVVEQTATEVIDRVGRALGAGPLCADPEHARRVADLTVYLRQSHAERDLAMLGHDVADQEEPW